MFDNIELNINKMFSELAKKYVKYEETFQDDKGMNAYLYLRGLNINYDNINGRKDRLMQYARTEYKIYVLSTSEIDIEGFIQNFNIFLNNGNEYSADLLSTNSDAVQIVKEVTEVLTLKKEWFIVEFRFNVRERVLISNCAKVLC